MRTCSEKVRTKTMISIRVLIAVLVCMTLLVGETEEFAEAVTSVSSEFVGTNNTEFVLEGSSFLFNGFNAYWMMQVAAQTNQRFIVTNVFLEAAKAGLAVCRTWAFSDGGDRALQKSPGLYDERFFQALDFVVYEARKYGMKLIMSLANNYPEYGGRHQYVQWARRAGVAVTGDDDFYTNAVIRGYYKNHIKTVLSRMNTITKLAYKEDPTIMAWELMNEPRCRADTSGKTLGIWINEMGNFIKSIDKKHLVTVGMEGFYSTPDRTQYNPKAKTFGTDFIHNHLLKTIDFATIHAYPDIWLARESQKAQMQFMQRWLTIHWRDSKAILKKPLIVAEFGKSKKDPGYSVPARDSFMDQVYSIIYNLAKSGGTVAGGMVWQIMGEKMESYYDGYEIVLPLNPTTSNIIHEQSIKMISLGHS